MKLYAHPRVSCLVLLLLLTGCSGDGAAPTGWYGVIERDRHSLSAPVSGIISAIHVREGDTVQAGQVLLSFDQTSALAQLQIAQAQLAEANAQLLELQQGPRAEQLAAARARLEAARASLRDSEQRLERARQLVARGAGTQADLDQALASRDLSAAGVDQARQQLDEFLSGTRSEQLLQASARADAAQGRVQLAQRALDDLTLVAAHHAVVDSLPWRSGDRVNQGSTLISLLIDDSAYVRVYVPANALPAIAVGTTLLVQTDNQTSAVTGSVRHIRAQPAFTPYYALNERDRARLMYLTEVSVPASQRDLPSGLGVEVRLP